MGRVRLWAGEAGSVGGVASSGVVGGVRIVGAQPHASCKGKVIWASTTKVAN